MPSEPVKCHLVTHMYGCRHLIPNLSPMTISGYEAIGSSVVAHMAIPATDYAAMQSRIDAAEARATAAEGRVRDLIDDYQLLSIEVRAWRQFYRDTKAKIDALDVKLDDALARTALRKDAATQEDRT